MRHDPHQQLQRLTEQVRANERVWKRLRELEVTLLRAQGLRPFFEAVVDNTRDNFGLAEVRLWLRASNSMRLLLRQAGMGVLPAGVGLIDAEAERRGPWPMHGDPLLTPCGIAGAGCPHWFSGASGAQPGSAALLPLQIGEVTLGWLVLGAADPQRYRPGLGTDLLSHFTVVVAATLQHAIHVERLRTAQLTDGLTQLPNRAYLDHRILESIASLRRHGGNLGCILVDIDHFKRINDTYGHPAGDAAIREVAAVLRTLMRTEEVAARYGGEEFVVLLPGIDLNGAAHLAERLRHTLESTEIQTDPATLRLTASFGVSTLTEHDVRSHPEASADRTLAAALLARADAALYHAKQTGRNRVVLATQAGAFEAYLPGA